MVKIHTDVEVPIAKRHQSSRILTRGLGNALALAVYGFVISPVLRSGFIQDDRFDSLWGQTRHSYSLNAVSDGIRWTDIYTQSLGRFHPIAHVTGSLSFEISDRVTFKIVQFGMTILVAAALSVVLNVWTRDKQSGPLAILCLAAISQFRVDFDPILSFGIHTKILVLILLVQLLSVGHLAKGTRFGVLWRCTLLVSLLCGAMFHEIAVVCAVALVFLTGALEKREKVFINSLVVWVTIAYVAIRVRLYLSTSTSISMPYYQLSLEPVAILTSFAKQLSGLIPFISTLSWQREIFPKASSVLAIAILISLTILLLRHMQPPSGESQIGSWRSIIARLSFVFLWWMIASAGVVSLSGGHQQWAHWGGGYINIWIAQIAMASILGICLGLMFRRTEKRTRHSFAVLAAAMTITTSAVAQVNSEIVDENPIWQSNTQINGWEREQTVRAIQLGIVDNLSVGQALVSSPPRPWMNDAFVKHLSGNEDFSVTNSWPRFGEIPGFFSNECRHIFRPSLDDHVQQSWNSRFCAVGDVHVLTSVARDYRSGYTLLALLLGTPRDADPVRRQLEMNSIPLVVKQLSFVGSGRFSDCMKIESRTFGGQTIVQTLSGGIVRSVVGATKNEPIFLNSVIPRSC